MARARNDFCNKIGTACGDHRPDISPTQQLAVAWIGS
jgi:hypothetical protein